MLKILTLLLLSLTCNEATSQTFSLNDSVFTKGQKYNPTPNKVFFSYNSDSLLENSHKLLDSLAEFLLKNSTIILEIGVHTDMRANDHYSYRLGYPRAVSVKSYLIAKGINQNRLIAKGYWKDYPIISEAEIKKMKTPQAKEEAHYKNRRTEFKIVSTDYLKEIFQEPKQ